MRLAGRDGCECRTTCRVAVVVAGAVLAAARAAPLRLARSGVAVTTAFAVPGAVPRTAKLILAVACGPAVKAHAEIAALRS